MHPTVVPLVMDQALKHCDHRVQLNKKNMTIILFMSITTLLFLLQHLPLLFARRIMGPFHTFSQTSSGNLLTMYGP